jgi:hypothetical protein
VTAATVGAERAAAGLARLALAATELWDAAWDGLVNALAADALGRCARPALALWGAAGRARARLTLAGLTAALGAGLAVLGAVWDAAR